MGQARGETAERKPLYPRTAESADESLAKLKSQFAEEMRMERCTKMLEHVLVLPDDKQRLLALIGSGISVGDFTDELEKAVNRRKKKEAEKHVTADEKASLLEDELISELAELEEEVGEDSEKLEEDILREIEDLERL
jgi:predicted AAA+ superfamily ATPase